MSESSESSLEEQLDMRLSSGALEKASTSSMRSIIETGAGSSVPAWTNARPSESISPGWKTASRPGSSTMDPVPTTSSSLPWSPFYLPPPTGPTAFPPASAQPSTPAHVVESPASDHAESAAPAFAVAPAHPPAHAGVDVGVAAPVNPAPAGSAAASDPPSPPILGYFFQQPEMRVSVDRKILSFLFQAGLLVWLLSLGALLHESLLAQPGITFILLFLLTAAVIFKCVKREGTEVTLVFPRLIADSIILGLFTSGIVVVIVVFGYLGAFTFAMAYLIFTQLVGWFEVV